MMLLWCPPPNVRFVVFVMKAFVLVLRDSVRARFKVLSAEVICDWLACTFDCGIFVDDARVLDLVAELEQQAHAAQDVECYFSCRGCRHRVTTSRDVNEQQKLWTD